MRNGKLYFKLEDSKYSNEEHIFEDIGILQGVLMRAGYVTVVYDDDTEQITMEFIHNESRVNSNLTLLKWLTDEEREEIINLREAKMVEE